MTESFIQLPIDGAGKKTRTKKAIVGGQEVHQQVVKLSDALDVTINPATEDTLVTRLAKTDLNLDAERDLQVDIKTMPTVSLPAGLATEETLANRAIETTLVCFK